MNTACKGNPNYPTRDTIYEKRAPLVRGLIKRGRRWQLTNNRRGLWSQKIVVQFNAI